MNARAETPVDPYAWLEEVEAPRSLDWVRAHNARTRAWLEADPGFAPLRAQIRSILDSKDQIPYVERMGTHLYNFWRDGSHPRGLWRRTTLEEYRKADPAWEPVLDLDVLATAEKENWVWKGATCRYPAWDRCLVSLSRGGADAVVVREFDLVHRRFVEGGFFLPEAKSDVTWDELDAIYVGTDFGPGSLTDSGYPRVVKRWRRGTPLAQAELICEGQASDVATTAIVSEGRGYRRTLMQRAVTFFSTRTWLREGAQLVPIATPDDARIDFFGPQLLVWLRGGWTIGTVAYPEGSLLAIDFDAFRAGARDFQVLFSPTPAAALSDYAATRHYLVLDILEDVRGRLQEWHFDGGRWSARAVAAPEFGSLAVDGVDHYETDDYFLRHADFLTPDSLILRQGGSDRQEPLKRRAAYFDASGLHIEQNFATSRDGTRVPYFLVRHATAAAGSPTLLYGYGGFEVALTPSYSASIGKAWLERGGTYVLANIRGGGEYGPRWHAAALREKRQNAFDDFIAVAEDLRRRGIASPSTLGILGGSNGGLLMGAMLTQRPDLFGAVVCAVPLLDMRRYHRLLAGASWMDEYGNPDDPQDWAYIARYSPYQNLRKDVAYPPVLFATSTRDDRVHPAHARKMMARMEELGAPGAWYYENIEGGHAGAADNAQLADMTALEYTFLWNTLAARKP